jgi:hypothetical protein
VIAFNEYVNDDGTEVAVVQIHPDAESMAFHMEVIAERAAAAYAATVDATTSIQVFGTPSNAVLRDAGASGRGRRAANGQVDPPRRFHTLSCRAVKQSLGGPACEECPPSRLAPARRSKRAERLRRRSPARLRPVRPSLVTASN